MTTTIPAATAHEVAAHYFPAGGTVSTITERDGGSRRVRVLAVDSRGLIRDVTANVAAVLPYRMDQKGRIIFHGVGLDVGAHITASLAHSLHGDRGALDHHAV